MEAVLFVGFFCLGPLALLTFGFWLGRGMPGFPWKVVKRDDYTEYEDVEDHPIYAGQKSRRFSS